MYNKRSGENRSFFMLKWYCPQRLPYKPFKENRTILLFTPSGWIRRFFY
jgi:hypothetical protein